MGKDLLSMLKPECLLDRFDVVNLEKGTDAKGIPYLKIHLDEKNVLDQAYDWDLYESKGFHQAKSIVDFPIRGRYVNLVLRRRRMRCKDDPTQIVSNDLSFLAEGTKMTRELAAFPNARQVTDRQRFAVLPITSLNWYWMWFNMCVFICDGWNWIKKTVPLPRLKRSGNATNPKN